MKKLKDMGVDDNTIVVFTTDNGTENFTWPDGGQTPFAGGKGTALEGGFRAPAIIRWPGKVPAGKVENGIISGLDWFPTFVAAAGNPNIADELKKGKKLGDQTYKVHLDGYNQTGPDHRQGPVGPQRDLLLHRKHARRGPHQRLQVPLHRSARTAGSAARSRSTGRSWPICVSTRSSGPACPTARTTARSATTTGSSTSSGASCSSSRKSAKLAQTRHRVPADAEGRELQPGGRQGADRSGPIRPRHREVSR